MLIYDGEIIIRDAEISDAAQLCAWWNDGSVMAHAGFPLGLGTTEDAIAEKIVSQDGCHRHMILFSDIAIGEMNYRDVGDGICEIGIKICDASMQNRGIGKKVLRMFIGALFDAGYRKIVLDTNLNNTRAQHVYETLGFRRVRVNANAWTDQLGVPQSSVDYELLKDHWRKP